MINIQINKLYLYILITLSINYFSCSAYSDNFENYNMEEEKTKLPFMKKDTVMFLNEDGKMLKSYNQDFYSTLASFRNTKILPTISNLHNFKENNEKPNKQQLIYQYYNNNNASVTSTSVQIWKTLEDIVNLNNELKYEILDIKGQIKEVKVNTGGFDTSLYNQFIDHINNIKLKIQTFLVNQKSETFKLIKEIAIMCKEKIELQNRIYQAMERIRKIEEEVGSHLGVHISQQDQMIKSHSVYENKFLNKD